jgi:hypothetical protein
MNQIKSMIVECLGCGEQIHPKRLEILPNTKYCVSCSDTGRKRGVTVQRGEGDHSYTDVVILEEKQFISYIIDEGKMSKGAKKAELQNFEEDETTPQIKIDQLEGDIG